MGKINMEKTLIALGIVGLLIFSSFQNLPKSVTTAPSVPVTKVWVSNNSAVIQQAIDTWSKYGYEVQNITCQSVALGYGENDMRFYKEGNFVKGDIILVMVKK